MRQARVFFAFSLKGRRELFGIGPKGDIFYRPRAKAPMVQISRMVAAVLLELPIAANGEDFPDIVEFLVNAAMSDPSEPKTVLVETEEGAVPIELPLEGGTVSIQWTPRLYEDWGDRAERRYATWATKAPALEAGEWSDLIAAEAQPARGYKPERERNREIDQIMAEFTTELERIARGGR